jgi:hypothetical protein
VDVSVFVGEVPDRLPPGGVIVFDPEPGGLFGSGSEVRSVPADPAGGHPLVSGLDLAGVLLSGVRDQPIPAWATPVLTAAGRTVALAGELDGRRVVILAFDPDAGGVPDRLAYPLLVARAVEWAAPAAVPATVVAGGAVDLPPGEFAVQGPDGQRWTIGGRFEDTVRPGLYVARAPSLGRPRTVRFGVQAGDVAESNLIRPSELPDEAPGRPGPSAVATRRPLWGWFVALTLAVALVEGAWRGWWFGFDRGAHGSGP